MKLIKATGSDDFEQASLILSAVAKSLEASGQPLWTQQQVSTAELKHSYPLTSLYFLEQDFQQVGVVFLQDRDELFWPDLPENDSSLFIHKLALHPEYRGRQLGHRALKAIAQFAREHFFDTLRLDCHRGRQKLNAFYRNFGFEFIDRQTFQGFDVARYLFVLEPAMTEFNGKLLEQAAFRAWPADEQISHKGVVLRAAHGYTKRANSANLIEPVYGDFPLLKTDCEQFFHDRGLQPIFRLPSFSQNQAFDQFLEEQGYKQFDRSLVMAQSLDTQTAKPDIETLSLEEWLITFSRLNGASTQQQALHLKILSRIKDSLLPAVLTVEDDIVCCGLGVLWQGYFGLFDLVTGKGYRQRGYAKQLLQRMLCWAKSQGGQTAYLQVVEENNAARQLYTRFGYATAYEYWYRVRA